MTAKKLIGIFLFAFIAGCAGILAFCCYALYRQAITTVNFLDPSLIHHLKKPVIALAMLAGMLGIGVAGWNYRLINNKKKQAVIITMLLWLACAAALAAGYWLIARAEGRYLYHSRYFRLYLYGAIPIAVCMMLGVAGMIGFFNSKNESNPGAEGILSI